MVGIGAKGGRPQGSHCSERCLRIQEAQAAVPEAAYLAYVQSRFNLSYLNFIPKTNIY